MSRFFARRDIYVVPLVYLLFGLLLTLSQNRLIYLPDNRPFGECPRLPPDAELIDGSFRGYYFPSQNETLVVIYHGNAGNACHRSIYASWLAELTVSVLVVEYPGFADPYSRPSTRRSLAMVPSVVEWVEQQSYQSVHLIGESIGSGFASYHSTHDAPDTLVLITPFARLSERAQEAVLIYPARWLLFADLDVATWAASAPRIHIIAAETDSVVPRHHTDRVVAALPEETTTVHIIPGTDHNTLYGSLRFQQALREAIAQE